MTALLGGDQGRGHPGQLSGAVGGWALPTAQPQNNKTWGNLKRQKLGNFQLTITIYRAGG